MEEIVFSVIIPTYNRQKLVVESIKSVLRQTFEKFELIVVDDGSTDNTKAEVAKINDARLIYIYKENGGQNSALNRGLEQARGEYVAFLDSDDIWSKNKLQKIYDKYMNDQDISCVYHSAGKVVGGKIEALNDDYLEGYIYREVLLQEFMSTQISLSCKRSCFEKIGFYDEQFRCFQDDDMCFQLAKNFKVGLVKEVLSLVDDSASERVTDNSIVRAVDYWKLLEKYKEDIVELCGIKELRNKYIKAMALYCRAKMWCDAYKIRKILLNERIAPVEILRINIIYVYELLKGKINVLKRVIKLKKWGKKIFYSSNNSTVDKEIF